MCVCAAGVGGDVRRVHVAVAVAGTWLWVAGGAGCGHNHWAVRGRVEVTHRGPVLLHRPTATELVM